MLSRTWEQECFPLLVTRDGDEKVALCVLWHLIDKLSLDELAFNPSVVGNLRTPIGIGWFLRGLWQFPHIQHVIIWGPDLTRTGEALLRLWHSGVTDDGRIPGDDFRWKVDPLVDRSSIDVLRDTVRLYDARSCKSIQEIPTYQLDALIGKEEREPKVFPPIEIPERSILPSRGADISISGHGPGDTWIQILNAVMKCGDVRRSRKGEDLIHYFKVSATFPVPEEEVIPTEFNLTREDLEIYYKSFISAERSPGIDYHYGERVFNWKSHNQVHELIDRLRTSLDTKRGTIVALEASDIEELEDAPCWAHSTYSVNLMDLKLSSANVFRSHDMYEGWPMNILTLLRLHRYICAGINDLGVRLGQFCITSENAQIYGRHIGAVLEKLSQYGVTVETVIERFPFDEDPAGNFIFEIRKPSGVVNVTMTNPMGDEILWEAEHMNPAILVRWIVASMPWLKPDHVRYLGVEEEKLRRSLTGRTPYVQG
jgi:thymidylate synthase